MNPFTRKSRTVHKTTQVEENELHHEQTFRDFDQVESLLRHDAAQTPVPPALAERLRQSLAQTLPPRRKWWLFWRK